MLLSAAVDAPPPNNSEECGAEVLISNDLPPFPSFLRIHSLILSFCCSLPRHRPSTPAFVRVIYQMEQKLIIRRNQYDGSAEFMTVGAGEVLTSVPSSAVAQLDFTRFSNILVGHLDNDVLNVLEGKKFRQPFGVHIQPSKDNKSWTKVVALLRSSLANVVKLSGELVPLFDAEPTILRKCPRLRWLEGPIPICSFVRDWLHIANDDGPKLFVPHLPADDFKIGNDDMSPFVEHFVCDDADISYSIHLGNVYMKDNVVPFECKKGFKREPKEMLIFDSDDQGVEWSLERGPESVLENGVNPSIDEPQLTFTFKSV
ncbi:hypothetical protein niasHT_032952 [Heterodera trifolii]|uniref:Uncharacterized protein n=1 Tax=Heterodera trifolii TaxID=157864 RepID=A0ABD2ILF2_9BILA